MWKRNKEKLDYILKNGYLPSDAFSEELGTFESFLEEYDEVLKKRGIVIKVVVTLGDKK